MNNDECEVAAKFICNPNELRSSVPAWLQLAPGRVVIPDSNTVRLARRTGFILAFIWLYTNLLCNCLPGVSSWRKTTLGGPSEGKVLKTKLKGSGERSNRVKKEKDHHT
eukprot:910358-Pleurochrysis_carterae.AAC.1